MPRKDLISGAVGAVVATTLVLGAQLALAEEPAVNATPTAPSRTPASFADVVARVAPAVVSVDVEGKSQPQPTFMPGPGPGGDPFQGFGGPFGDLHRFFQFRGPTTPQPMRGTGSGFFISADGYIVTNNHVVEHADTIKVRTNDGRTLDAELVGRDPATDLAVLKVAGDNFPYVGFEDRAKPRVGDWVVAVGNPFNLGGTATAGIVSAIGRPNVSGSSYVDYMQIDAPINRGNSGGPTFDLYGRVVGVNSAILSPSGGSVGIGFDIPADVAARVSKELIAHGKVTRGYIGATVQDVTPEIAESLGVAPRSGALVADVVDGGPSARGGLKSGDVVLEIDGQAVHSAADLTKRVAVVEPGSQVRLLVRRDGHRQTLTVKTDMRPSETVLASNDRGGGQSSLGLMVSPHAGGGLTVNGVSPASEAARRGVRAGDVIEQVGGHPADDVGDLETAVASARSADRDEILLRLLRGGRHLFVALHVGDDDKG
jgi:serine protease Do